MEPQISVVSREFHLSNMSRVLFPYESDAYILSNIIGHILIAVQKISITMST